MDMVNQTTVLSQEGTLAPTASVTRPELAMIHPVDRIQQTHLQLEDKMEVELQRSIFGDFFPKQRQLEEALLREAGGGRSAGGLPVSGWAVEVLKGVDEDIDYHDFMGDTPMSFPDPHLYMERKLALGIVSETHK